MVTLYQIDKAALERSEVARSLYRDHMDDRYLPNQLVFVDKSASDRRIHRHHGHSLYGERAFKKTVFIHGKRCSVFQLYYDLTVRHSASYRFSVLPALSLDGILAVKIVEGSFTTELFKLFIAGLLDHMNPFPGPNSVIVMDNCRIHRAQAIRDMIEERLVIFDVLRLPFN